MFEKRIKKAQDLLASEKIEALLVSSSINIGYLTGNFSFSKDEREAYLLLTKRKTYLFTDFRYIPGLTKTSRVEVVEISAKHSFPDSLKTLISKHSVKILGFENTLSYHEYQTIKRKTKITLKLKNQLIEILRSNKDSNEIKQIEAACILTDKAFKNIVRHVKSGVSEKFLAWKIEQFIKESGEELAFSTIIAFGPNSAVPHHTSTDKKLTKNTLVLFDMGAKVNNYCADMTRVVFFGKATNQERRVYETVLEAQKKAIKAAQVDSAVKFEQIHETANKHITKEKFPSIPHSVGHGVGLEVHELPYIRSEIVNKLSTNSVFTVEPGIYLPGSFGIRIEDTLVKTVKGVKVLTKSPKLIFEI